MNKSQKEKLIEEVTSIVEYTWFNMGEFKAVAEKAVDHILEQTGDRWVSVEDRLPESSKLTSDNQDVEYIVMSEGARLTDINYTDGAFKQIVFDHDEDFSHYEELDNVEWWLEIPEPPPKGNKGEG
jgi:hypothetical protein